jgi:hypothetical protein
VLGVLLAGAGGFPRTVARSAVGGASGTIPTPSTSGIVVSSVPSVR